MFSFGQWRSHVQPSGSDDTDDLAVTPYSDQFLAGYNPAKILVRPQWPSSSSNLQSGVHLLSPATAVRNPSTQGHIRELEKAIRPNVVASLLPIQASSVRCAPFLTHHTSPAAGVAPTRWPALSRRSFSNLKFSGCPSLASRQDKVPLKYPITQFAINNQV